MKALFLILLIPCLAAGNNIYQNSEDNSKFFKCSSMQSIYDSDAGTLELFNTRVLPENYTVPYVKIKFTGHKYIIEETER